MDKISQYVRARSEWAVSQHFSKYDELSYFQTKAVALWKDLSEKEKEQAATILRELTKQVCPPNGHVLKRRTESAYCGVCLKELGWWCPKSPTHLCEYNTEKDPVHDFCIHCGHPEERL